MTPSAPLMRRSRNGCFDCRRAKAGLPGLRNPELRHCRRHGDHREDGVPGHAQTRDTGNNVCVGFRGRFTCSHAIIGRHGDHRGSICSSRSIHAGLVAIAEDQIRVRHRGCNKLITPLVDHGHSQARDDSSRCTLVGSLSLIPRGAVSPADASNIETYFKRHPFELLMGEEFVNEMNANVLLVLQHDPAKMADALSAIGYAYLAGDSPRTRMMVLARRARILANLRTLQPSSCYFEQALFLLLVLCAMELVTLAQPGHEATIPKILINVASLIGHHLSTGGEISFVGRYLLRALARQDLVVSLVQMRRPCIPTYAWLDMTESHKADRLLGYTVTLMPLLEELCTMAEEVRSQALRRPSAEFTVIESIGQAVDATSPDFDAWLNATPSPPTPSDFHIRAESLRHRLSNWRPTINDALPFRSSRKFRAQAASYRAGALLYLHRLQNPPRPILRPVFHPSSSPSYLGSVPEAHLPFEEDATPAQFFEDPSPCDAEALCLAHDIMLYASGPPPAETKLLLWPVFLAACEMCNIDDRSTVGDLFDSIATHRGTVTVERTRRFVEQRVWRARDAGEEWNWMELAQRYPGECLPI